MQKQLKEFLIGQGVDVIKTVPVAGAVILKKNKDLNVWEVLLIRRTPQDRWPLHWEYPRGKCNSSDKNLKDCLIREVKEEVGLDVEIIRFIDKFEYLADGGARKSIQYNFLCTLKDDKQPVVLGLNEHDMFKWVSSMGEVELLTLPDIKKTIVKVLNINSKLVDYPHTTSTRKIKEMIDQFMEKNTWLNWW
jgi:8-oxo-dGTP pyrophosphatase MutT (NUDIX family)